MNARRLQAAEPGFDPANLGCDLGLEAGAAQATAAPRVAPVFRRRRLWSALRWPIFSAFIWGFLLGALVVFASVRLGYAT